MYVNTSLLTCDRSNEHNELDSNDIIENRADSFLQMLSFHCKHSLSLSFALCYDFEAFTFLLYCSRLAEAFIRCHAVTCFFVLQVFFCVCVCVCVCVSERERERERDRQRESERERIRETAGVLG